MFNLAAVQNSTIKLTATTWQQMQKGKTYRIQPFPPAFEDYNIPERNPEEERQYFLNFVKTGKTLHYSIIHEFLDHIGFVTAINFENLTCEIGIEIFDPINWRKGYGSKTLNLFFEILKAEKQVLKIIALVHPDNLNSQKFFEKNNFKLVGKVVDEQEKSWVHLKYVNFIN